MKLLETPTRRDRALRIACVFALVALALMTWSVVDPRPMPVVVALSLGQVIGTISFLLYLLVVAADLGVQRQLRAAAAPKDPPSVR